MVAIMIDEVEHHFSNIARGTIEARPTDSPLFGLQRLQALNQGTSCGNEMTDRFVRIPKVILAFGRPEKHINAR